MSSETISGIDPAWMPPSPKMKRIIAHWTAGQHKANSTDRSHYHILIEGNGKLIRGTNTITDNESTSDGDYAAHTKGSNTNCIGVSMCCMAGCEEDPFVAGSAPMTQAQWQKMCQVIADLCKRYGIPVSKTTVLGHGEVQGNLGITQNGKWDPLVLPWNRDLTRREVDDLMRETVAGYLETPARVSVSVNGHVFTGPDAFMDDGQSFVALRGVADLLKWQILVANFDNGDDAGTVSLTTKTGQIIQLAEAVRRSGRAFVRTTDLATALKTGIEWNATTPGNAFPESTRDLVPERENHMKIDLSKLTPEQREKITAQGIDLAENLLGVTPERVKEFYDLSEKENPDFDTQKRRDDVVGKFRHFWRKKRRFEGAVDVFWEVAKPYVEKVVDAVIATAED